MCPPIFRIVTAQLDLKKISKKGKFENLKKLKNLKNLKKFEKKFQICQSKNTEFFKIANSQYFFVKVSGISPWVYRIN